MRFDGLREGFEPKRGTETYGLKEMKLGDGDMTGDMKMMNDPLPGLTSPPTVTLQFQLNFLFS